MKSLLTIFTLVFSVTLSSTSFAEWTKVTSNVQGTLYIDFERIRKQGGYVYYWILIDYLGPTETGTLSGKVYKQGDCKLFRLKFLSVTNYTKPMGGGTGETYTINDGEWQYALPDSTFETSLKSACSS